MITIGSNPLLSPDPRELLSSQENLNTARLGVVSASMQSSADFTLMTTEGDRVTISTSSLLETAYTTYDYRGQTNAQSVAYHQEDLSLSASNELSIMVQGNLNHEERKDLHKALKRIEQMVKEFMRGDLDHAMKRVLKIAKLDSLSSLEASLQYGQSVSFEQAALAAQTPQIPGAVTVGEGEAGQAATAEGEGEAPSGSIQSLMTSLQYQQSVSFEKASQVPQAPVTETTDGEEEGEEASHSSLQYLQFSLQYQQSVSFQQASLIPQAPVTETTDVEEEGEAGQAATAEGEGEAPSGSIQSLMPSQSLMASLQFQQSASFELAAQIPQIPITKTDGEDEAGEKTQTITPKAIKKLVHEVVEVAHDSKINLSHLIKPLKTLLPLLVAQLSREEDFDPPKLKLANLIQSKLIDRLEEEHEEHKD